MMSLRLPAQVLRTKHLCAGSREVRMKCPGQDTQNWKSGDIFEAPCPNCGRAIEFFKDDTSRRCKGCGERVPNPKLDFGCAEYCEYADQCLAGLSNDAAPKDGDRDRDVDASHTTGSGVAGRETGE
jgi:hypothetical protein